MKPCALANLSAPGPTRKTRLVRSMTRRATFDGFLMFSSAPTAPDFMVRPSMTEASSCTTPSSLGMPPYPTVTSSGSSSTMLTPEMTASSGSPPDASTE